MKHICSASGVAGVAGVAGLAGLAFLIGKIGSLGTYHRGCILFTLQFLQFEFTPNVKKIKTALMATQIIDSP